MSNHVPPPHTCNQLSPPIEHPTKTPTHTLIRVRNNQRRHRQRRREYIESLEQKLRAAEEKAQKLEKENARLRRGFLEGQGVEGEQRVCTSIAENPETTELSTNVESLNIRRQHGSWNDAGPSSNSFLVSASANTSSSTEMSWQSIFPSQHLPDNSTEGLTIIENPGQPFSLGIGRSISLFSDFNLSPTTSTYPSALRRPSSCCSNTSPQPNIFDNNMTWPASGNASYHSYSTTSTSSFYTPTPTPSSSQIAKQSTTLCTQAYLQIHAQNRRGLSMEIIESWLGPGFVYDYDAVENGCRVDNGLLLVVLEWINWYR